MEYFPSRLQHSYIGFAIFAFDFLRARSRLYTCQVMRPYGSKQMKVSNRLCSQLMGLALACLVAGSAHAAGTRIAILDFELKDLTGVTPIPADEVDRTASVAPLLRETLAQYDGYQVIAINGEDQLQADEGFGYLFDHPDESAKLGARYGAELVAVGRVHKPSFLFAYLKVHLVDVDTRQVVGDYVVEVKGSARQVTERGAVVLARQIDETLQRAKAADSNSK
jgi:hypothetical protein